MGKIYERYTPVPVAANSTVVLTGSSIGGFLCSVSGSITVVANASDGKDQTNIITNMPVTAGVYHAMPFFLGVKGGTITTSGGAVGTVAL